MKNEMTDNFLNEIFKDDELNCKPNQEVKSRLDYAFMLKGSQGKIRQNSFLGMFTWIFSLKNIPAAAALVSIVLLFSVLKFQQKSGNFESPTVDTASILPFPLKLDSVVNRPFDSDTCFVPGI